MTILYKCPRCHYQTSRKYNMYYHLFKRKTACKEVGGNKGLGIEMTRKAFCDDVVDESESKSLNVCKCCNTSFSSKSNLNKHVKLKHKPTIKIFNFEDVDTSHISADTIHLLIEKKGVYHTIPHLAYLVFINDTFPSNKCIHLLNKKSKYVHLYQSGYWQSRFKKEIFENIIQKMFDMVHNAYSRATRSKPLHLIRIEKAINYDINSFSTSEKVRRYILDDLMKGLDTVFLEKESYLTKQKKSKYTPQGWSKTQMLLGN